MSYVPHGGEGGGVAIFWCKVKLRSDFGCKVKLRILVTEVVSKAMLYLKLHLSKYT